MKTRIITAIIGIILVLGLVILGNWILTFAVLAIAGIALTEYGCMLERLGIKIRFKISCIFLALIILSAYTGILKFFVAGLFGSFLILCFSILKISKKSINDLMYTVFGVLYLGIGFGSLLFLRQNNEFFDIGLSSINNGVFTILFALIGTWASDSFAYLVGKRFGKHKMAPHISPNKTLEGSTIRQIIQTSALLYICTTETIMTNCDTYPSNKSCQTAQVNEPIISLTFTDERSEECNQTEN